MAEYIKRTDAMKICLGHSKHCFILNNSKGQDIADKILDDIIEIPTADVVEVKYGEWIDDGDCFHCSACNKTYQLGSLQTIDDVKRCWRYCANCGAINGRKEK